MEKKQAGEKVPGINFSLSWGVSAAVVLTGIVVLAAAWGGVEYFTSKSSFCGGSCHTMTEQYEAWKSNTHHASNNPDGKQAECVDCHFLPGEKYSLKSKYEGLRHLAAYLYDPDAPLPIRPVIPDGACLQSGCHEVDKFSEREIQFTDKVRFKHTVHLGEKALDGQKLTCDTCHFKVSEKKHFEVPKDICFLCHLKLEKPVLEKAEMVEVGSQNILGISFADRPSIDFNQGVSRCDICHTIPTKSLQSQLSAEGSEGDNLTKPITHQTIQEAGVACESCHFEVVKGAGEIVTGNVVSNGCLRCHNRSQTLIANAGDRHMHDKHIAAKTADCFDCHATIEHENRTDHLDFVRTDCQLCHVDQHKYQKLLLSGVPVTENLSATPHLMFEVNTNCMACHLKKTVKTGHAVRTASGETCASCHTSRHKKMLADWKSLLEEEVMGAEEAERDAFAAFEESKLKVNKVLRSEVEQKLATGRELLNIVRFGNGVHNKKYSIMILDEAFANFDDSIELLEKGK